MKNLTPGRRIAGHQGDSSLPSVAQNDIIGEVSL